MIFLWKTKTYLWLLGLGIILNIVLYALLNLYVPYYNTEMNKYIIFNIVCFWIGGMLRIIVDKRSKNDKS